MKAEHRKELETNALADRVGRAVQGMKQMPRKRTFVWVLAIGLVAVVAYWFYAQSQRKYNDNAFDWYLVADGKGDALQKVMSDSTDSNQSKVVNFERGFLVLYDTVRRLADDPKAAFATLDELERHYRQLAKQSSDDKVLLPEALFAIAVIEETRILDPQQSEQWQKALAAYKEVADKHPDSAFGKEARKRVAILNDEKQRDELLKAYQDLRLAFVREEPRIEPPDFFPDSKTKPSTPPKSNITP
jgi:hypothetical protein